MRAPGLSPPPHVYVVDDEPQVRTLLARLLARNGYEVSGFSSADEARTAMIRAALARSPVDVVLLDMALRQGSDNTEQAESLLQWLTHRQPRTQVILMSGQLSPDDFFGLIMRGAADYVAKPWVTTDLLTRVHDRAAVGRQKFVFHHSPHAIGRLTRDAFLSYSSRNDDLALGLCRVLERMDVSTWYAAADVPPGEHWPATLDAAIQSCPVFVALLTQEALESGHVMREISRAYARREAERETFLFVPVTSGVSPRGLPEHLRELHAITLNTPHGLVDSVMLLADRITTFAQQQRRKERGT